MPNGAMLTASGLAFGDLSHNAEPALDAAHR